MIINRNSGPEPIVKNPDLVMLGEIKHEAGEYYYYEWLWEKEKLIMHQGAFCRKIHTTADPQWPNWLFNDPPNVRALPP
jgi:hypothetical protein